MPRVRALLFPQPYLQLRCLLWGTKGLQTGSSAPPLHICKPRVSTAHRWSLNSSPRASATNPGTPCLYHQDRAGHGALQGGQLRGGGGAALTIAEEAGGARALQDVVLTESPIEALHHVLGVALALPTQALAPARAWLHVPGADADFIVR